MENRKRIRKTIRLVLKEAKRDKLQNENVTKNQMKRTHKEVKE